MSYLLGPCSQEIVARHKRFHVTVEMDASAECRFFRSNFHIYLAEKSLLAVLFFMVAYRKSLIFSPFRTTVHHVGIIRY